MGRGRLVLRERDPQGVRASSTQHKPSVPEGRLVRLCRTRGGGVFVQDHGGWIYVASRRCWRGLEIARECFGIELQSVHFLKLMFRARRDPRPPPDGERRTPLQGDKD